MKKVGVILDTDLGSDCDDAGALTLLHNLIKQGWAELLAITHCTTEIGGTICIKAINEYYDSGDIPIGRNQGTPFLEDEKYKIYTKEIAQDYLKNNDMPIFENSVRLMRRILANNQNVTLITIGMMNNVAELLSSQPDDICDMSGYDLIMQSIDELYVMGGNFEDFSEAEYNIACDLSSARYVADTFPKPIVYCGFEIGATIRTGALLKKSADENPVKKIYSIFSKDSLRESWDPITVYAAINKENAFLKKSAPVSISFDNEGRAVCRKGGKDRFLILSGKSDDLKMEIDKLIV